MINKAQPKNKAGYRQSGLFFNNSKSISFSRSRIKYGLSIGRRQPFHNVHLDCIKEIIEQDLILIIINGSANKLDNPNYNPYLNPLSPEQQTKQIKNVFAANKISNEHYKILDLEDCSNSKVWVKSLVNLLIKSGINPHQTVMHYRTKADDKNISKNSTIKPLDNYRKSIIATGISIWRSVNKNKFYDCISATPMRTANLEAKRKKYKGVMLDKNYILQLAKQARVFNPELGSLPITMLDLTLNRFKIDKKITAEAIFKGKIPKSIKGLDSKLKNFIQNQL